MKWWKKKIKHVSLDAQLKIQNCTCDTYITKAGLTIRSSSFLVLSLSKKKIANYMPQQWFNGHEKMTSDKISRFVNSPWQRSWLCNCSVYASDIEEYWFIGWTKPGGKRISLWHINAQCTWIFKEIVKSFWYHYCKIICGLCLVGVKTIQFHV